jgi:hypothetical protein
MTSFPPSPKVESHLSVIAKNWHCGKLYPVTAAQLFLIFTGFLVPDALIILFAKNWLFFSDGKLEKSRMEAMCR